MTNYYLWEKITDGAKADELKVGEMRNAKTDQNQAEIVKALRQVGATVHDLSAVGGGCPDILVGHKNVTYLIEIKNPDTKGKLNKLQQKWHAEWRGQVAVVETVEEALRMIGVEYD